MSDRVNTGSVAHRSIHELEQWVSCHRPDRDTATGLRSENSEGQCLQVIIGMTPEGRKEGAAIVDVYQE